jgi:dTMP kinase
MEGKLIVFEGLDKSGKETQARMLAEYLKNKGIDCIYTEEPTPDNVFGKTIKEWLDRKFEIQSGKSIALLYTADRYEHMKSLILPKLEDGVTVICDRYFYSTIAYQSVLYGVEQEWIMDLNRFARKPDITIFLDIPPEESVRRARTADRHENLEFQVKVKKAYDELVKKHGFVVIDGNRSREDVFIDVRKAVMHIFEGERGK